MAISKPVYEDDESIDEQIRSSAAERSAGKTAPDVSASDDTSDETSAPVGRGNPSVSVPAPSSKRTPIVTKEQLAASGLSLRDYLNKQQGLTRRGEPSTQTRMPSRPGQEQSVQSNEGRNKPTPPKTSTESKRSDSNLPVNERIKKSLETARQGSGSTDTRPVNQRIKEALGFKKGGAVKMSSGGSFSSASRRADGIAQRGKTKGKMC